MIIALKKKLKTMPVLPILKKIIFWKKPASLPPKEICSKKISAFSPEKKAELDKLCLKLLKNKELIISGKLQFIGLTKIKKRMGKQWEGLRKIVYETAENVIDTFLDNDDIYIRYQDDTYIMLFAKASVEEGQIKGNMIAEEIRKRLFALDEAELRKIEIRQALCEIHADMFPDFLDLLFPNEESWVQDQFMRKRKQKAANCFSRADLYGTEIDASDYKPETPSVMESNFPSFEMNCLYAPLWEIRRNALTTYLALARGPQKDHSNVFYAHEALYSGQQPDKKAALDRKILEAVAGELARIEKEGRKLLLICPVQHETLFNMQSYEAFKQQLTGIPQAQRQFLVLLVMNSEDSLPPKNAYWFATPLRQFCRHVFVEVPLRRDINFNHLRNAGVDTVGVRLDKAVSEQETIILLNAFCIKAKSLKIPKTFILNVTTLSLATSAVCAGFDYMGGKIIGDNILHPETMQRYRHENLIAGLIR